MKLKRLVIYPTEASFIIGKSETTARALFRTIKDAYGKTDEQLVTIKEFSDYCGLSYEEVYGMLN